MILRNEFRVADAHTIAYQTLSQFASFARQMATIPEIKTALDHAPEKATNGRGFLQIVMDDAMDSFVRIMAKTISNSDVTFEDIPQEFYLKLMHDRHGGKVTKQEALDDLKIQVEAKLKQQNIMNKSELPSFIRLTMDEMKPQELANTTNKWAEVVNSFALLMMSEQGLAAKQAALEITRLGTMEAQQNINRKLDAEKREGGGSEGSGKSFKAALAKLKTKELPPEVKEKVEEELDKLDAAGGGEEGKIKEYLIWIANLPWNEFSKLEDDLNKTEKTLDEDHYGLDKVKQAIIEHVAIENHTGGNSGRIILLVGPPGVGKTSIAKSIAKATGREYARMALGGIKDEAEIRGHSRTYVGAKPGRLMEVMKKVKKSNPVLVLDEVDKMSPASVNGDPTAAMLEVLDPEQNNSFHDHFVELDFDLSKVLFIATANDINKIPAPLLDRMEKIQLTGYTREEKLEIAKRHLITKRLAANGLTDKNLEIKDDALASIISDYTREAGVRGLEREIDSLCRKVVLGIEKGEITKKTIVTAANLEDFLGASHVRHTDVKINGDRIGIVNGLAWSESGGSILQIGVKKGLGKDFNLEITGHLGEVMSESGAVARRVAIDILENSGKTEEELRGMDIHVHALDGAVPKDGPSAGAAMTLAIISAVTEIPIRSNVAMTGEISLHGDVMPIGGLPEKLDGAIQDGADTVLIPKDNEQDLEDVPKSIRDKLEIRIVSTIEDVLKYALTEELPTMKAGPSTPGGNSGKKKSELSSTFAANDDHKAPQIEEKKTSNAFQAIPFKI